ncbi:hypothetical protein VTJ04DRAFT_10567 [Mycothermus thermophilus]|uniref:uncharacterized protein n=1 Tax=Humicola insolens TaxID=85995 RepID=UPI0037434838
MADPPNSSKASTFEEWEAAAKELDELEGNDAWKLDDNTGEPEYRPDLIRAKLQALEAARANSDIHTMMYLIRTSLSRDVGGMGSTELYLHSYIGTKALIEQYVQSAVDTINSVVEMGMRRPDIHPRDLLEGMVYARQSFGRSALLLSGGATFGMAHIGVLKSLFDQNLLPRIISGASAGSIICSVLCSRTDEELPALVQAFEYGDMSVFNREDEGLLDHIRRLLTSGSWADISNLTRVMRSWLGDITFREAYNRTRRICNICVSSASMYDIPRLLNYVTAPNVLLWSAVAASCSVPFVFQGHPLIMKHPITGVLEPWIPTPQQLIDGSVDNDLPMTRLAEMFNVNHFIVSQVNPHVIPFLSKDEQVVPGQLHQKQAREGKTNHLAGLKSILVEEGMHRMQFMAELGIFPNLLTKILSVMSQKYSGDINILPEIPLSDLPLMLKNPTVEFMQRHCLIGERATWPKMSRIRHRLAIELALDKAVHALRTRVVFSKSQVDLRRALGLPRPVVYRGMTPAHHYNPHHRPTSEYGEGVPVPETPFNVGGFGYFATQPPSVVGGTSLAEERTMMGAINRRHGSGASIQLAAARHVLPLFGESGSESENEEEEEEEEGGRLELRTGKLGLGRIGQGAGVGSHDAPPSVGNSNNIKNNNIPRLKVPRLKRNAKSQQQMRAGKPVDVGISPTKSGFLLPTDPLPLVEGPLSASTAEEVTARSCEVGDDRDYGLVESHAGAEEEGGGDEHVTVFTNLANDDPIPDCSSHSPSSPDREGDDTRSFSSDSGMTSDANPYFTHGRRTTTSATTSTTTTNPRTRVRGHTVSYAELTQHVLHAQQQRQQHQQEAGLVPTAAVDAEAGGVKMGRRRGGSFSSRLRQHRRPSVA